MKGVAALALGLLFALGLGVSGMTRPDVVLGFLDFAGAWNPALLFVMASAVPVFFLAWKLRSGPRPVLGGTWPEKVRHDIDSRLLVGSAIFGVGWGLCGVCPGPAITLLGRPNPGVLLFVASMVGGMVLVRWTAARRR